MDQSAASIFRATLNRFSKALAVSVQAIHCHIPDQKMAVLMNTKVRTPNITEIRTHITAKMVLNCVTEALLF
jgi:hypothetical protein